MKTMDRRLFLFRAGIITLCVFFNSCLKKLNPGAKYSHIAGTLKGPNVKAGHILRDKKPLPPPVSERFVKTLIIGSGVSGLSAARWLKKQGHTDFEILELESFIGGNAHSSSNSVTSYPLGAHYIPIVNNSDNFIIDFLQEAGVITHIENGLPFYNEHYLCFDPEERLLINGHWQESLVPEFGLEGFDREQIKKFFEEIKKLKSLKGNDQKYAFDIPLDKSSADEEFMDLDKISFKTYLLENGYTSPYLQWYLDYCCKDDYGRLSEDVSAWAGLHYFASRRGEAANAESTAVLTWPEGNGWLIKKLADETREHIRKDCMCYNISYPDAGELVIADIVNTKTGVTERIKAEKIILATPQFINQKIINIPTSRGFNQKNLQYSPWFVANVTVNGIPSSKGPELCWDNVGYNTLSVGYINSSHQHLSLNETKKVLTWYLPLCSQEPRLARLSAYTRNYEQWLDILIPELEYMHPGITYNIERVDGWVWGHGMIAPTVGYIWGNNRKNAQKSLDNKVFFAHSDLSGISIFEEAFHQGIKAAADVLSSYKNYAS